MFICEFICRSAVSLFLFRRNILFMVYRWSEGVYTQLVVTTGSVVYHIYKKLLIKIVSNTCSQNPLSSYIQPPYNQKNFYLILRLQCMWWIHKGWKLIFTVLFRIRNRIEFILLFNLPFGLVLIGLKVYVSWQGMFGHVWKN